MDIIALWLRTHFVYVSIFVVYLLENRILHEGKKYALTHILYGYIHAILLKRKYVSDTFHLFFFLIRINIGCSYMGPWYAFTVFKR